MELPPIRIGWTVTLDHESISPLQGDIRRLSSALDTLLEHSAEFWFRHIYFKALFVPYNF